MADVQTLSLQELIPFLKLNSLHICHPNRHMRAET